MKFTKAYINIALLKYWGKADEKLHLPLQDSLSVTAKSFYTLTSVEIDTTLDKDLVSLNNNPLIGESYKRVVAHLDYLRKTFKRKEFVKVISFNNGLTKAGLASSASGFAALTKAYLNAINKKVTFKTLSTLARRGSGSAARSIHGGFVLWHKGSDHLSSFAERLPIKWPSLRLIFILISQEEKAISSREGMALALNHSITYPLFLKHSQESLNPMLKALKNHNLPIVGKLMEENALLMNKVMLESGLNYQNEKTFEIINLVKRLRNENNISVYYTFDAGANLILLIERQNVKNVLSYLKPMSVTVSKIGGRIHAVTA